MEKPLGSEVKGDEEKVYRLKKTIYGLKQVQRSWYNMIDEYLLDNGFYRCDGEPTRYIKESHCKLLIVFIYVDDFIFS